MKKARELPSQDELLKLFYYDNGLKWLVDKKQGSLNVKVGDDVAGSINSKGYYQIMINGIMYKLSRIVYQTVYGNLTNTLVIDHVNRDRGDNRIENLRLTTRKYNSRNKNRYSNSSTEVTGVHLCKVKRLKSDGNIVEYQKYVSHWYDGNGKRRVKYFSISKYGKENAFRLACEYRQSMIESLRQAGEWYDENHGI